VAFRSAIRASRATPTASRAIRRSTAAGLSAADLARAACSNCILFASAAVFRRSAKPVFLDLFISTFTLKGSAPSPRHNGSDRGSTGRAVCRARCKDDGFPSSSAQCRSGGRPRSSLSGSGFNGAASGESRPSATSVLPLTSISTTPVPVQPCRIASTSWGLKKGKIVRAPDIPLACRREGRAPGAIGRGRQHLTSALDERSLCRIPGGCAGTGLGRSWLAEIRGEPGPFSFTDDGSSVLPFAAVASLPICRRRHEAANLSREQAGEFDRRRVLVLRADDLQAHR